MTPATGIGRTAAGAPAGRDRPATEDAMHDDEWARLSAWYGAPVVPERAATTGSSNVTWFVRAGERPAVLRHPPRRADRLPTAHDLAREATVLRALEGTAVPVARVLAFAGASVVLEVPLLLAARMPGRCLLDGAPDGASHEAGDAPAIDATALAHRAVDVLAELHAIDPARFALDVPSGSYLARQIDRWRTQLARTPTAPRLGDLDPIADWLHAHRPPDEARTIVHGDYGFHNLLVSARAVEAVLDWELATLGDPLADLHSFLKSWGADAVAPNPANDVVALRPGAPTRRELLARYEARTGRPALRHARFYEVFGLWRSIGIFEGIHARSGGARFRDETPALVQRARASMREPAGAPDAR